MKFTVEMLRVTTEKLLEKVDALNNGEGELSEDDIALANSLKNYGALIKEIPDPLTRRIAMNILDYADKQFSAYTEWRVGV